VAFSASAFDEWGNNVPVTPTWRVTAGGGAINDQGIFAAATSGVSTITADVDGIATSATATAQCVPPRTETAAGLTFTVVCGAYADVWLNGNGLDGASITKTVDGAVVAVEAAFGRSLTHRLNVNVFATKAGFDIGLKQLLRVEPTPLEEGVFIPPAIVAIDWSAPDIPEAIARHEITHLVVDEAAGRRIAVPYWLHEGLATLNEFPVSADTALISRYCTASAAKANQLPALSSIATGAGWRAYVNDVGVIAYYFAAQVASFVVADSASQSNLLDKIAGGLSIESAYTAASGRPFETFTSELGDRAVALADGYPGIRRSHGVRRLRTAARHARQRHHLERALRRIELADDDSLRLRHGSPRQRLAARDVPGDAQRTRRPRHREPSPLAKPGRRFPAVWEHGDLHRHFGGGLRDGLDLIDEHRSVGAERSGQHHPDLGLFGSEHDLSDEIEVDHRQPDLRVEHRLQRVQDLLLFLGLRDDRCRLLLVSHFFFGHCVSFYRRTQATRLGTAVSRTLSTIDVASGAYSVHPSRRTVMSPGRPPMNGTRSATTRRTPKPRITAPMRTRTRPN
jgi:hypothetical protein